MSIIATQSLFPVIALNLGTTVKEDIKDKKVYKITQHYFAVFSIKTPNRVYFIQGSDDVVVPKLSELITQPCLHLGKDSFDVPLPVAVINNLVNFLKDPTMELSGFYLYDLYAHGFITSDYFASRIIGLLKPQLDANDITVESIDSHELIKLAHKSQASKLGLSGDNLDLKARLKAFVNTDPKVVKRIPQNTSKAIDTQALPVTDDQPTETRKNDPENESLPELKDFKEGIDPSSVDLSTMNKRDLKNYAKTLGCLGWSKMNVYQLKDAITEKLTAPDPFDGIENVDSQELVNA